MSSLIVQPGFMAPAPPPSIPSTPPAPAGAVGTLVTGQELEVFQRIPKGTGGLFARQWFTRVTGIQPPSFDPTRLDPNGNPTAQYWWDSTGAGIYRAIQAAPQGAGPWIPPSIVAMGLPVGEVIWPNLPGRYQYPMYTPVPTAVTIGGSQPISPNRWVSQAIAEMAMALIAPVVASVPGATAQLIDATVQSLGGEAVNLNGETRRMYAVLISGYTPFCPPDLTYIGDVLIQMWNKVGDMGGIGYPGQMTIENNAPYFAQLPLAPDGISSGVPSGADVPYPVCPLWPGWGFSEGMWGSIFVERMS